MKAFQALATGLFLGILQIDTAIALEAGALQRNIEQQLPQLDPLPSVGPQTAPIVEAPPLDPNAVKILVKSFKFEGNQLFNDAQLQETIKPWLDKSLTLSELQEAANAVAAFYQAKGRLAQVSIPPQTLENGQVLLKILEARLGGVNLEPNPDLRFNPELITRHVTDNNPLGELINTDHIERSIFLLRETPGIGDINTELAPGDNDGDVILKLKAVNGPRIGGLVGANNSGSASTGQYQINANVVAPNPFKLGDQLSFNAIAAQGLGNIFAGYSFPLGTNGWRMSLSGNQMVYRNIGSYSENGSYGNSNVLTANLAYPLLRSVTTNANVSLQYDQKTYTNKSMVTDNVVSNYQIGDLTLGVSGNHYDQWMGGGVTMGSASITNGNLNFLPAQYDAGPNIYGSFTPTNFQKMNFSLSRSQQLVKDKTVLNTTVSGQLATENLDPAEQFFLGGTYAVQAYPVGQGKGSQGMLMLLELQQMLGNGFTGSLMFQAGRVQQYVKPFEGWQGLTNANNWYNLAGAGPSIKWSNGQITASASVSWAIGSNPLYNSAGEAVNTDNRAPSGLAPAYAWFQISAAF